GQLGPIAPVAPVGAPRRLLEMAVERRGRASLQVIARAPARGGRRPRRAPTLAPSTALLIRPRQARPAAWGCSLLWIFQPTELAKPDLYKPTICLKACIALDKLAEQRKIRRHPDRTVQRERTDVVTNSRQGGRYEPESNKHTHRQNLTFT